VVIRYHSEAGQNFAFAVKYLTAQVENTEIVFCGDKIMTKTLLDGKRVLIVDDEPDVLATLEDLLSMCDVVKASSFLEAKDLLTTQYFDLAILDIMGVDGYKLLEIAVERKVIAVMLTAHALSPEDTVKSFGSSYEFVGRMAI